MRAETRLGDIGKLRPANVKRSNLRRPQRNAPGMSEMPTFPVGAMASEPESNVTGVTTAPSTVEVAAVALVTNWFTRTLLVHDDAP